jgi:hypothetical protein
MKSETSKSGKVGGIVRQGDVLLVPVDAAPFVDAPAAVEGSRFVLAEGEATGHAHVVRGRGKLYRPIDQDHDLEHPCLVVEEPATLVHEEHDAIVLAPGAYEVRRQREYVAPTPRHRESFRTVTD